MINEDGVEIEHGMVVYEPWKGGYYLKKDADAKIAELEKQLAEEKEFGLNRAKSTDRELNRQKYLRCESLIKVCMSRSQTWMCRYSYAETEAHRQVCFDFAIHYNQRAEVLRKLAEKLKVES